VILEHALAAGALVKSVDVLRNEGESRKAAGEFRQRQVTGVRFGLADQLAAELVPVPDELRVALKRFWSREFSGLNFAQRPVNASRNVGIPLSAEIPAPVITQTCRAL